MTGEQFTQRLLELQLSGVDIPAFYEGTFGWMLECPHCSKSVFVHHGKPVPTSAVNILNYGICGDNMRDGGVCSIGLNK